MGAPALHACNLRPGDILKIIVDLYLSAPYQAIIEMVSMLSQKGNDALLANAYWDIFWNGLTPNVPVKSIHEKRKAQKVEAEKFRWYVIELP